jgi:hypothetical protein
MQNTEGVPMQPIPAGFRMVMGEYNATSVVTEPGKLGWYCQNGGNETMVETIP